MLEDMGNSKGMDKIMKNNGTTKLLSGEYDMLRYVRSSLHSIVSAEKKESDKFIDVIARCNPKDNSS